MKKINGLTGRVCKMQAENSFTHCLVEAVIPADDIFPEGTEREEALLEAVNFFRGQLQSLPPLPGFLFASAMTVFRLMVLMRHRRGFGRLPLATRQMIVFNWAWGRVSLARQLFRVVRCTALMAFFELDQVKDSLETPSLENQAQLES